MSYDIDVGAGARLVVRSVAATIVLPGASTSTLAARVTVDSHAELDWAPEPLVSVTGSRHQQHTVVRLSPSAAARWRELVVLGRSGEEPGTLVSTLRVERAGRVICHHETRIGESARGWNGPAGLGAGRVMLSEFRAGGANHVTRSAGDGTTRAAVFSLATDASLSVAVGPALGQVTGMLDTLAADRGAGQ